MFACKRSIEFILRFMLALECWIEFDCMFGSCGGACCARQLVDMCGRDGTIGQNSILDSESLSACVGQSLRENSD